MVFDEGFTVPVFQRFLKRLIRQAKRMVSLIVDRHPIHRARKIKEWFESQEDKLRLFFLPSYSPELGPDELLNQDLKSNAPTAARQERYDCFCEGAP